MPCTEFPLIVLWTLLVLRNLTIGPQRFKDLLGGLPGIGSNRLADRLKHLEREGVVRRRKLPPPAGSTAYELTDSTRAEIMPAVFALGRWGYKRLGKPKPGQAFRPAWAVAFLKATSRPWAASGVHESYELRIDDEVYHLTVDDGAVEAKQGPASNPAFVMAFRDAKTLQAVGTYLLSLEDAIENGRVTMEGEPDAMARFMKIFSPPPPPDAIARAPVERARAHPRRRASTRARVEKRR
jgi:DNA-binding HxlR family transcriptional regulator